MDVFSDMENFGSSILTSLGFGNGVNYSQLATDIAEASFGFQRQTVETRRETLEAQISAASQLRSAISGLASALGDRIRNGELAPQASIGNAAVARASVPAGLSPRGNFSLEVTELARSQTLVTGAYASGAALVGAGTLNIRFGEVDGASFNPDAARDPLAITVTADDTLATLAARITRESRGAVSAYVAQGTGGAQLVLKGAEGAANGFVLEPVGAGGAAAPGDLSYLAWNPATDAGELRGTAGDASLVLDTVPITSPTNRVTGLPGGFTLELTATNIGAPTTVSFTNDTSAITAVMNDFVAALNDIATQLNTVAAPLGGELGNDSGARELRRELSALSRLVVNPNAAPNEPRTLGDLGLAINRDGTFRLDPVPLNRALEANPEAVAGLFTTGATGVFAAFDRFAREATLLGDPGSLGGSVQRYERQLEQTGERLARIAEQQEALRERLSRELIASGQRVTAAQTTLEFVRANFAPRDDNN